MVRRLIRYFAAFMILLYGFAKINGSQFTILDSELDKPMGQVSGFWLTWYYFGYSWFYGNLLGAIEIAGGLLLTFRRTTMLGACLLAAVLGNVVIIDLCYGVDRSGTIAAIVLFGCMLYLLAPYAKYLKAFFWPADAAPASSEGEQIARWSSRVAMVALTFGITYWVANYNNRNPTPIDGTWDVVAVQPPAAGAKLPQRIYFEYNRAGMAVFKGDPQQHQFQVDRSENKVSIHRSWMGGGDPIFDGAYKLDGQQLTLIGNWTGLGNVTLAMRQRKVRR